MFFRSSSFLALFRQVSSFAFVGGIAAIAHFGILIGLVELFSLNPIFATMFGFIGGALVSYGLNRHYTYKSDRPHGEATWRFGLVAGAGFLFTIFLMYLQVDVLKWNYIFAQCVSTFLVLIWNFLMNKFWTFKIPR